MSRPFNHTVLVTGANRGLGLEFVRQWLERDAQVIATARKVEEASELVALRAKHCEQLRLFPLDVADDGSVQMLANALADVPIHLLINNAGVGGWGSLRELETEYALRVFNTNALGPVRVTRALLPNLRKAAPARVVNLTSGMGSIGDNTSGGSYAYRMSKAALNMATRNLAHDLRSEKILAVVINPGHVKTDMGGRNAPTEIPDSIAGMIQVIEGLKLEDSGRFLNWKGGDYPW